MNRSSIILSIALLLAGVACERQPSPGSETGAPVSFPLNTKSLGEGEHTYLAALFSTTHSFRASGTYCDEYEYHSSGTWLSPCRVDNDGQPLNSDGDPASNFADADKDSRWGLRLNERFSNSFYLVAASPAKALSSDGNRRYYHWLPSSNLSVSDPVSTTLFGSFLDGQYVYESSSKEELVMKNRRARLYIHIECGELSTAYIQSVELLNCVTAARWYLTTGLSASNFTTGSYTLFDYVSDNAGSVLNLVKNSVVWDSTLEVFLPAIDYSSNTYVAMRPQIKVLMGNDPAHPSEAVVDITEPMDPMKNYTFNLLVSKSDVIITLIAAPWEDEGTISSVDNEEPAVIGTVTIDGWTDGGANNTDNWNTSFGLS